MESYKILEIAANALNSKKAKDINAVQVSELTVIAEYFLICTATSSTHVRALSDEVQEKLKESGAVLHHVEGNSSGWIVLDYTTVIIHIFSKEKREFYSLDKMWSDGKKVDLSKVLIESEENM